MERIRHLLPLISGLCLLSSCVPQRQYLLVKTPKTWSEAQSYCREKCSDLATMDDMAEMETGLKAVEVKSSEVVWIGLQKRNKHRWHWSLADKHFYKKGERNYLMWGTEEGNNCAVYQKGKLYTTSCGHGQYSVCFDGQKHGHEQYVLITTKMVWTVARDYCRTYHTDLVSVRNKVESQILQEVAGGQKVWTGLFRDPWTWSDQTYSSFRYWRADETVWTKPGVKECAALFKTESGRWGEAPCDEEHPFLCNCRQRFFRFIKVRIGLQDSEVDLNKAAVQDDILKQIKLKLGNTSVTDVFQLQWKKDPDRKVFNKAPS